MRYRYSIFYYASAHWSKPVAERPFEFEMELDDLPKDVLKRKLSLPSLSCVALLVLEMIYEEAKKFPGSDM